MSRTVLAIAVGISSVVLTSPALHAQGARVHRVPTLSQRLEQFRQDMLGSGDDEAEAKPQSKQADNRATTTKPAAPRVGTRSPFTKPGGEQTVTRSQPSEPISEERRQLQTARRAQPPAKDDAAESESEKVFSEKLATERIPGDRGSSTAKSGNESRAKAPLVTAAKPADDHQSPTPAVIDNPLARTARLERPETKALVEAAPAKPATAAPVEAASESIAKPSPAAVPIMDRGKRENVLFTGQSPLISVEASGPKKVLLGKEATFSVVVRNSGAAAASNVTIALNIPPYAEVVSAQPTTGTTKSPDGESVHSTGSSHPLEWKLARLESHGKETLTLKLIPRKSLPLDLAVQWTCSPESSQTLVEVQEPKLLLALSGPEEVLFGQSKVYKLTLSNPGNGDAENVNVSLMPIGRVTDAPATHKLGTLRAGESKAIEVELTARQAGTLSITAQAFGDGGLRSEVSQAVLVRRANLKVAVAGSKVKYAGTPSVYQIKVTNSGTAPAENTQVSALLPPEAKYISCNGGGKYDAQQGKVTWNVSTLPPEGEKTFEVQCTLQAAGENRMQTVAQAEGDISTSTTTTTRVEALADLKLEVRDPQGAVAAGDEAVYEVVIRNRGTKSAEGIELVMFFSEGLEAVGVQGGSHEVGQGQVVCKPIASLSAGGEAVFRATMKADRGGQHVFRAEVACRSPKTKIACEETTLFYDDDSSAGHAAEETAAVSTSDEPGLE